MSLQLAIIACLLAVSHSRSLERLSPRIIGSHDAAPGQFPHQISLQWGWPPFFDYDHFCGGSILNASWVVTAAHCVRAMEQFPKVVIKAGKHDLAKIEPCEQLSFIKSTYVHEKYNDSQGGVAPYDIALLKLATPLRFNKRVGPVSLPANWSEPSGVVALSGWGAVTNSTRRPKYPTRLQTVDVPIVERDECNEAVAKIGREEGEEDIEDAVDETNICTGPLTGGTAACSGDSGGPLTARNEDGQPELVGIVSWGMFPCGREGGPSVYVRVSSFNDWIEDIIANN